MAKGVVEPFEMVNIDHDDPNLLPLAFSPAQFPFCRFFHIATIVQAGEWVPDREILQSFLQLQLGQGQAQVVGDPKG